MRIPDEQIADNYRESLVMIKNLEKKAKLYKKQIIERAKAGIKFDEFGLTVYSSRGTDMGKTEDKWLEADKELPTRYIKRVVIEAHDEVNYPLFKAMTVLEENKEFLVLKKETWKIRVKKE